MLKIDCGKRQAYMNFGNSSIGFEAMYVLVVNIHEGLIRLTWALLIAVQKIALLRSSHCFLLTQTQWDST